MATRLCVLLLAAMLTWGAEEPPSDGVIHDRVILAISVDRDVRGAGIQVDVKNGVVTLKGQVFTKKGRDKAVKLTKKVKGVVSVTNLLTTTEDQEKKK